MFSVYSAREFPIRQWIAAASIIAANISLALCVGAAPAAADTLVDPPVFASQNGALDIMMVAIPQPIPTISFTPPASGRA